MQRSILRSGLGLILAAGLAAPSSADTDALTLSYAKPSFAPGELAQVTLSGTPGTLSIILFDTDPGPTVIPNIGVLDIGFSAGFVSALLPAIPANGSLTLSCGFPCESALLGVPLWTQAVSFDANTAQLCASNSDALLVEDTQGICIPCDDCDGGITDLTLCYTGSDPVFIEVTQKDKKDVVFSGTVQPDVPFSFSGLENDGTFDKEIKVKVDGDEVAKFKADCSDAIGPGIEVNNILIVAGASLNGGALCDQSGNICASGFKIQTLSLVYTGESCASTKTDQPEDKTACTGNPGLATPVHIRVANKDDEAYFDGQVDLGGSFLADAANIGSTKFDAETFVTISSLAGDVLQEVEFHTSCSQPLFVSDQYGSIIVADFTLEP